MATVVQSENPLDQGILHVQFIRNHTLHILPHQLMVVVAPKVVISAIRSILKFEPWLTNIPCFHWKWNCGHIRPELSCSISHIAVGRFRRIRKHRNDGYLSEVFKSDRRDYQFVHAFSFLHSRLQPWKKADEETQPTPYPNAERLFTLRSSAPLDNEADVEDGTTDEDIPSFLAKLPLWNITKTRRKSQQHWRSKGFYRPINAKAFFTV